MSQRIAHIKSIKVFAFLALAWFVFFASEVKAQNTKGDKPAATQRPLLRIPKFKSKAKGGDKAYTRDISGRKRIRTKNKSTAARAVITKPSPYANRRSNGGDKAYRPQGGEIKIIRSSSAQAARNNVFPSHGKFVKNPSPHPHDNQHPVSNRNILSKAASIQTKRLPPVKKKIITNRTASRSYVTRGRKNVYWGKFSKGERPITTDITGRTLRAKNYHTPGLGVIPSHEVYKKKKTPFDRPYRGTFVSGYATITKSSKPWRGNISGNAIRSRPPKVSQEAGKMFDPRKLSITNKHERAASPLRGSGYTTRSTSGRISKPIQGKAPGLGAIGFEIFLAKFRGTKSAKGGGTVSRGFNNNGQPIDKKPPGIGARFLDIFTGNIKSERQVKGGGSISGKIFNNRGQPIDVKGPGIGARFVDKYQGNIRGQKGFTLDGYGFAGNFKTRRAAKGGGSVSGKRWNNGNQPVDVKAPGAGARFISSYQGNLRGLKSFSQDGYGYSGSIKGGLKSFSQDGYSYSGSIKGERPIKGGGSISGRVWNNLNQPINVKGPGAGARFVSSYRGSLKGTKSFGQPGYSYSGSIKARRPEKGGGSVSGKLWNNVNQPIDSKAPGAGARFVSSYQGNLKGRKIFSTDGYDYSGTIKTGRPAKGGGSVSGKVWNNNNFHIQGKSFAPSALQVGRYSGNIKASRPEKGGGSVSGKVWNNHEQAIIVRKPASVETQNIGYNGFTRQKLFPKKYIRNPNAKEEALKKERPDKTTYAVGGLQVLAKPQSNEHNKLSAKGAINGISVGKNSLRAIEHSSKIKVLWAKTFTKETDFAGRVPMKKYVHNPKSKKSSLMVIAPSKADARVKDLQVNVKMNKPTGKNLHPDAQFANSYRDNVKHERTLLMNIKLKWAKLFKKNDTQPPVVKEKIRKPRYDKRERELWKALYD